MYYNDWRIIRTFNPLNTELIYRVPPKECALPLKFRRAFKGWLDLFKIEIDEITIFFTFYGFAPPVTSGGFLNF